MNLGRMKLGINSPSKMIRRGYKKGARLIREEEEVKEYVLEKWPCIDPLEITAGDIKFFRKMFGFACWRFGKAKAEFVKEVLKAMKLEEILRWIEGGLREWTGSK